MSRSRQFLVGVTLGSVVLSTSQACAPTGGPIAAGGLADCNVGHTTVTGVMAAQNWSPVTAGKWQFPGTEVILAESGAARPGPRRPLEYATLSSGPQFGSVQIEGTVRIDTPVEVKDRDVIILLGYRSDTEFYYVHLSTDNTIYPHNGIFVVSNTDRRRIDDQWNEARSEGAPPAITEREWHRVRVVHCADSGQIAVYIDGSPTPLMTATDRTFHSGRVGFGSFDNIGRLRDLIVTGTASRSAGTTTSGERVESRSPATASSPVSGDRR